MSSLDRKIRRNNDKLIKKLTKVMTKPDDECDNCTKPLDDKNPCYLTCKELYARNKVRNKDLIDKIRNVTGDTRI